MSLIAMPARSKRTTISRVSSSKYASAAGRKPRPLYCLVAITHESLKARRTSL